MTLCFSGKHCKTNFIPEPNSSRGILGLFDVRLFLSWLYEDLVIWDRSVLYPNNREHLPRLPVENSQLPLLLGRLHCQLPPTLEPWFRFGRRTLRDYRGLSIGPIGEQLRKQGWHLRVQLLRMCGCLLNWTSMFDCFRREFNFAMLLPIQNSGSRLLIPILLWILYRWVTIVGVTLKDFGIIMSNSFLSRQGVLSIRLFLHHCSRRWRTQKDWLGSGRWNWCSISFLSTVLYGFP